MREERPARYALGTILGTITAVPPVELMIALARGSVPTSYQTVDDGLLQDALESFLADARPVAQAFWASKAPLTVAAQASLERHISLRHEHRDGVRYDVHRDRLSLIAQQVIDAYCDEHPARGRRCVVCGGPFPPARARQAKTCSPSCAAERNRQRNRRT